MALSPPGRGRRLTGSSGCRIKFVAAGAVPITEGSSVWGSEVFHLGGGLKKRPAGAGFCIGCILGRDSLLWISSPCRLSLQNSIQKCRHRRPLVALLTCPWWLPPRPLEKDKIGVLSAVALCPFDSWEKPGTGGTAPPAEGTDGLPAEPSLDRSVS